MAPRAKRIEPLTDEDPVVDETNEQATLETSEPEGDPELEISRRVARRMGWVSKEEWKRDPAKWTDAPEYLENTPKVLADLQERSERTARAAAEFAEEERRRARDEATKVIETSDDPAERKQAAQRLAENAGPPPETRAWMARNPWFDTDPDAQALAVATVNRLAQRGASVTDQLAEAEATVKRRFPEYFASGTEQRLSDVRRAAPNPPQVQQGNRATVTQPKEKGFAQVPRADRQAFHDHLLKRFMSRGLTQEQAEKQYADSYWRAPPLAPEERPAEDFPLTPQRNAWAKRGGRAG